MYLSAQHHKFQGFSQQQQTIVPGRAAMQNESQDLTPWQQYSSALESWKVPAFPGCTDPSLHIPTRKIYLQTLGNNLADHAWPEWHGMPDHRMAFLVLKIDSLQRQV